MASPHAAVSSFPSLQLGRGVFVSPFMGPLGETILVAVRADGRIVSQRYLVPGDDHLGASDELWDLLELHDPRPNLKVI